MRNHARRTRRVLGQGIGNPSLLRKVVGTVREHAPVGIGTRKRGNKRFNRLGQNNALRAFGNGGIEIGGKNRE